MAPFEPRSIIKKCIRQRGGADLELAQLPEAGSETKVCVVNLLISENLHLVTQKISKMHQKSKQMPIWEFFEQIIFLQKIQKALRWVGGGVGCSLGVGEDERKMLRMPPPFGRLVWRS